MVRRRADEVVPECECVAIGRDDELAEVRPPLRVACLRDLVFENLAEQVEPERRPDHRRIPQQHPVGGSKRVDARRQQALDRLRQLIKSGAVLGSEHEFADEERIPSRALRECLDGVDRERELRGDRDRELFGGRAGERLQLDADGVLAGGHDRLGSGAGRDAHEPRSHRGFREKVREEETRCVVEPVAVLDHDQRRHHQDPLEERLDRPVELVAACGRVERRRLGGGGDHCVEGDREQRQPRRQVGHHPCHERLQHRSGLSRGAIRRDADELAQQSANGREGLCRRILLSRPVELLKAECERPDLLHEARFADPGFTHELDHLQLSHAREVDGLL